MASRSACVSPRFLSRFRKVLILTDSIHDGCRPPMSDAGTGLNLSTMARVCRIAAAKGWSSAIISTDGACPAAAAHFFARRRLL